uniref:Uncharacterized protein n=1 Tax=Anopheles melas TaxID=34690 RepID=A0A182UBX3_9DIPT
MYGSSTLDSVRISGTKYESRSSLSMARRHSCVLRSGVLRELSAAVALHLALRVGHQDAHHRLPAVLGREVERRLGRVHLHPVQIVVEQLDGQHGRVRDGAPSARVHLGDRAGRDHREDELADLVRTEPGGNVQRVQPLGSEPARMGRAVDQQPGHLADQAAHLSQVAHPNRLDEPLLQRWRRRIVRDDWLGRVARQPAARCAVIRAAGSRSAGLASGDHFAAASNDGTNTNTRDSKPIRHILPRTPIVPALAAG